MLVINNEVTMSAQWIVFMMYPGSSCLTHLKQLFQFKLVDHRNMLTCIMDEFIKRLRSERHQTKPRWYDYTPDSYKITDEMIGEFGEFMYKQFKLLTFTEFDVEYLYKLILFCSEKLPKEVVD